MNKYLLAAKIVAENKISAERFCAFSVDDMGFLHIQNATTDIKLLVHKPMYNIEYSVPFVSIQVAKDRLILNKNSYEIDGTTLLAKCVNFASDFDNILMAKSHSPIQITDFGTKNQYLNHYIRLDGLVDCLKGYSPKGNASYIVRTTNMLIKLISKVEKQ